MVPDSVHLDVDVSVDVAGGSRVSHVSVCVLPVVLLVVSFITLSNRPETVSLRWVVSS